MAMPQKTGAGQAAEGQLPYASTDWIRFKGCALSPILCIGHPQLKRGHDNGMRRVGQVLTADCRFTPYFSGLQPVGASLGAMF